MSAISIGVGTTPSGEATSRSISTSPQLGGKVHKSDFEIISVIGHGQSGTVVHLVRSRLDGEYYAMKTIDKWSLIERRNAGDRKVIDRASRERNLHVELMKVNNDALLGDASHAYFIKLFHTFQTSGHLYYVTEYCPMDVFEYISNYGPWIDRKKKFPIMASNANFLTAMFIAELSVAVDTIHKAGSIHRDIKIDNILISVDGHVRLSDFGSSKKLGLNTDRCDSIVGFSVSIMPPEFFQASKHTISKEDAGGGAPTIRIGSVSAVMPVGSTNTCNYGTAIDWYQVGICAYQVVTGLNPFHGIPLVSVDSPYYPPEWPAEADALLLAETKDLIFSLLHPDEKLRINSLNNIKNRLGYLPWDLIEQGDTKKLLAPFPLSLEEFSAHILPRMLSSGSTDEFDAFDPVPLATFNYNATGCTGADTLVD